MSLASFILRSALVIALGLALCAPTGARAAETNIAVLDMETLIRDSASGKSIQEQLKIKREEFQKEFSKKETDLRNTEKSLIEKKGSLSAEAMAEERKKFESSLLETRKLLQQRKGALEKGLGGAMVELRTQIVQVSADIADEKGYSVILSRDSVVVVEKSKDITAEVLKRLDSKVKKIDLKVE